MCKRVSKWITWIKDLYTSGKSVAGYQETHTHTRARTPKTSFPFCISRSLSFFHSGCLWQDVQVKICADVSKFQRTQMKIPLSRRFQLCQKIRKQIQIHLPDTDRKRGRGGKGEWDRYTATAFGFIFFIDSFLILRVGSVCIRACVCVGGFATVCVVSVCACAFSVCWFHKCFLFTAAAKSNQRKNSVKYEIFTRSNENLINLLEPRPAHAHTHTHTSTEHMCICICYIYTQRYGLNY